MSITLKDVAKRADVSVCAVSYVLNETGLNKVGADARERIRKAAAELNYTPNLAGRILNGGRSGMIGVVMSMRMPLVYNDVPANICMRLNEKGYQTAVGVTTMPKDRLEVMESMAARKMEGVLFFNCMHDIDSYYSSYQIPILHFDGMDGEIRMGLAEGEYLATKHLIEVHGHRRIGFFSSLRRFNSAKVDGYKQALEEAGIQYSEDCGIDTYQDPHWQENTLNLIRKHRLTAMLCHNDDYAGKLLRLLQGNGIRVPEDFAVIGYDGDCYAPCLSVPLTTVVQPVTLLVQRMADRIISKIRERILEKLPPETLHPYLHIERSCGCNACSELILQNFSGYSIDRQINTSYENSQIN